MKQPMAVSYGMGTDSTAMLIGLRDRGERPDLIMFADVGDEKPNTYLYYPIIQKWCRHNGFPEVVVVRYVPQRFKHEPYATLEENCLSNCTLPSLAFFGKGCSLKWKAAPMDKYVDSYEPFQAWDGKILRLIGYDAGPKDSKRGATRPDAKYEYRYPLREWGWTREDCVQVIYNEGLPQPGKSACFHCPSTQKHELLELAETYPDLALRAIQMEDKARPKLTKIDGLWGKGIKGTRKPESKRPGSWRQFLEEEGMLEYVEVMGILRISRQETNRIWDQVLIDGE